MGDALNDVRETLYEVYEQLDTLIQAVEPVLWDYKTIKKNDEYGLVWISTVYVEHITNLKATLDKIKEGR